MKDTSSHRWEKVRTAFKDSCQARNLPCVHCKQPIDYRAPRHASNAFEADHIHPRSTHPHLTYDIANLAPSHSSCNRSRQNKPMTGGEWTQAEEWD